MRGAIPPLPQYVFMAWCLVKHRDNFTFHLNVITTAQPPDMARGYERIGQLTRGAPAWG
jgi:hypothetical protein